VILDEKIKAMADGIFNTKHYQKLLKAGEFHDGYFSDLVWEIIRKITPDIENIVAEYLDSIGVSVMSWEDYKKKCYKEYKEYKKLAGEVE